jgi:acetyl esterase/lipase
MRTRLRNLAVLAILALCGSFAAAQERSPAIQFERDVVFDKAGSEELKLDLAMPRDEAGPFPAVVCIHGGGWVGGDRKQMNQALTVLANRGFVAISPDYRLAPQHRFPAQIEDCKSAVRWLRANAAKYKVDPNRIGAVGFSAGAHLACLLGVTDREDGLDGKGGNPEQSSRVQAVVSFFGPTDLAADEWTKTAEQTNLVPLLGARRADRPELYRKASPLTYADKKAAPFLFFHGTADTVVKPEQSRRLAEKLQAAGVTARVMSIEGEGHGWRGDALAKSLGEMMTFFNEQLKK